MLHRFFKHKIIIIAILCLLFVLLWLAVRARPATEDDIRRSAVFVEGNSYVCLCVNRDTIILTADTVHQQGVWINRHWWWPSCDGRVLTIIQGHDPLPADLLNNEDSLRDVVTQGTDSLKRLLDRKETERKELQYYLRSHGVIDEGYTQIAAYANAQNVETGSLKQRYKKLSNINKNSHLQLIRLGRFNVSWYDNKGKLQKVNCKPIATKLGRSGEPVILHTLRSTKPWGVYAVRNVPWGAPHHRKIIDVTLSSSDTITPHHALLVTGNYDKDEGHNIPRLFANDGSPVYTLHGRFIGIISGKEVKQ